PRGRQRNADSAPGRHPDRSVRHPPAVCCSDGWVAVAALTPEEAQRFYALAGADPEVHFAAQTQTEALLSLSVHDVPAEAVLEVQLVPFHDSSVHAAAGLHTRYQYAEYCELQQVGAFCHFGDLPLSLD